MDYSSTINLPKTAFPMKAGLKEKEPKIIKKWEDEKLYQQLMPGIGLDKYIRLAQNLRPEANKTAIENRINRSVNDQIVNTEFKPIIVTPDGKVTTNDGLNQGIGNDEAGGF